MDIMLRPAAPRDAAHGGRILYEAFKTLADRHGFPPDFPSAEVGAGLVGMLIEHPGFYGVVAERNGELLGTNFMDERSIVSGIGPISVDPSAQNAGVGRLLMQDALDRAAGQKAAGVRLLQAAYHNRSLCLYTTLGFRTREPMSVMGGSPPKASFAGYDVRRATSADLARVMRHAERGDESLGQTYPLYAGHDLVHLAQIRRIRAAIGAPAAD